MSILNQIILRRGEGIGSRIVRVGGGSGGGDAPIGNVADFRSQAPWVRIEAGELERPLEECLARDPHPLPTAADREGYFGERHYDYWLSGLQDYLRQRRVMKRHGADLRPGSRVLDLGCSTGRVLRHFQLQWGEGECWGADINQRNIAWMLRHLPRELKVVATTALPHLPFEDGMFSAVSAYSVFTHIDDLELSWLLELRRVLEPGGVLYASLHMESL